MVTTLDGQSAVERADSLFEQASLRLRAGELTQAELERTADRVEALARRSGDEAARIEIEAIAELLLQLPACLRDEASFGLPRAGREPARGSLHQFARREP